VTPVRDSACFITREHSSLTAAAGQVHARAINNTHRSNWAWSVDIHTVQWQTCVRWNCVWEGGTNIIGVFFLRWGYVALYCHYVLTVTRFNMISQVSVRLITGVFIFSVSLHWGVLRVFNGVMSVFWCSHCGSLVLDSRVFFTSPLERELLL